MTRKRVFSLLIMLVCLLVLFALWVSSVTEETSGEGVVLDQYITIEVHRTDGSIEHYDSNYFESSTKGDLVVATIPLPEEHKIDHCVLNCSVYQCVLTLRLGDRVLYAYGAEEAAKGRAIGNVLINADIPEEAWGQELTLECQVVDYTDFSKLNTVTLCDSKNRIQYMLGNKVPAFVLSLTILIAFSVMFFVMLWWGRGGEIKWQGIFLSTFCVGLMMWQMGYERMFYVMSNNVSFCGMIEYVGIYFAPAPFCMFMCYVEPGKLFQRVMKTLAAILITIFTIATILNFTTANFHYCRYLKVVHLFIGIIALVILIDFIFTRCRGDNKRLLIRIGVALYVFFVMSDMLLFYIEKMEIFHIDMGSKSITSLGLYVFLLIVFISYLLHVMEHVISVNEKERLENMAYQDGMTGVGNRRSCMEYLEKLKNNEKKDYTIFFFDVNDLKNANDEYGHDEGDHLITTVAEILKKVFGEEAFCGRYGGDEFIVGVDYSSSIRIKHAEKAILDEVAEVNQKKQFPFKMGVAFGHASKSESENNSVDEVLQLADDRMYECKRKMKE